MTLEDLGYNDKIEKFWLDTIQNDFESHEFEGECFLPDGEDEDN